MAAIDVVGYLLLGLGPGAAAYVGLIGRQSFVALLTLFSAFLWLAVMLVTSALLRGFAPLPRALGPYAGALLAAVAIEEAARYGVWRMHSRLVAVLEDTARRSGHRFTYADHVSLAVGWGAGHAATHGLFLFAPLLALAAGGGSYYTDECPQLSALTVAALNCLGATGALLAMMVVALSGWSARRAADIAFAPLVHAALALSTLGALKDGGCVASVATVLALGVASCAYACRVVWRDGVNNSSAAAAEAAGEAAAAAAASSTALIDRERFSE